MDMKFLTIGINISKNKQLTMSSKQVPVSKSNL